MKNYAEYNSYFEQIKKDSLVKSPNTVFLIFVWICNSLFLLS